MTEEAPPHGSPGRIRVERLTAKELDELAATFNAWPDLEPLPATGAPWDAATLVRVIADLRRLRLLVLKSATALGCAPGWNDSILQWVECPWCGAHAAREAKDVDANAMMGTRHHVPACPWPEINAEAWAQRGDTT